MDFELDSEQTSLRDAVRDLLKDTYPSIEERRAAQREDPGFDEKAWRRLAEMGVLGLPFAEDVGGMGAGPVEVGLVAEELGRVIAPEPFLESVVLAGGLVDAAGTQAQRQEILGALSEGEKVLAFAHHEPNTGWRTTASGVTAERDGDGWLLSGVKEPVVAGARADVLVVSAKTDAGTELFLVDGDAAERTSYRTADGGRAARIRFDRTAATPLGEAGADRAEVIEQVVARAQIAACREVVGAMERALWLTVDYLKTRKQFGVTLNTFQALKFRAADMYVELELAKSMASWATLVLDAGGDAPEAASRAIARVSKAGRHVGQEAVQLHGGIAMTDEYSAGHYLTRITTLMHGLGGRGDHLSRLAERLGDHTVVDPFDYVGKA